MKLFINLILFLVFGLVSATESTAQLRQQQGGLSLSSEKGLAVYLTGIDGDPIPGYVKYYMYSSDGKDVSLLSVQRIEGRLALQQAFTCLEGVRFQVRVTNDGSAIRITAEPEGKELTASSGRILRIQ